MNKKLIGILITVLLVCIIVLNLNVKGNEVSKVDKQILRKSVPIDMTKDDITKETQPTKIDKASKNVEVDESNKQTLQFHQDPVLDYRIALSKFSNCIQYYNPMKSFGLFDLQKQKISKKQQSVVDKYHKYCDSIKNKYPYYFSKDGLSGFIQADPNLQKLPNFNNLSEKEMIEFVQTKRNNLPKITEPDVFDIGPSNAYSIIGMHISLKSLFSDKVYPELKVIIGGNDQIYLTKIVAYAENKIACELGADCASNSNMMVNYCKMDENNCELSFIQMYDTRLSRGQQLDINATVTYLEMFFGF